MWTSCIFQTLLCIRPRFWLSYLKFPTETRIYWLKHALKIQNLRVYSSHITKNILVFVKIANEHKNEKTTIEHFASSTWCRQRNITFLQHVFSTLSQHNVHFYCTEHLYELIFNEIITILDAGRSYLFTYFDKYSDNVCDSD